LIENQLNPANTMSHFIKLTTLLISLFSLLFFQNSKACICVEYNHGFSTLEDTKRYDFIALVKITGEQDYQKETKDPFAATIGFLNIKIVELFKGEKIDKIFEYSKYTSCDMGVSVGEEWIMLGHYVNGQIYVHLCGGNEKYKKANEFREWQYGGGFRTLKDLRKLYNREEKKFENGNRQEFYSNRQIEIEEEYLNGMRNGKRIIWYPNGVVFCRQTYVNDTLNGKSEWFYPSGQISNEDYYAKGKPYNVSRRYYDSTLAPHERRYLLERYKTNDSLNFVYKRVQIDHEKIYNSSGEQIIYRRYSRIGKVKFERFIHPQFHSETKILYYNNGSIRSIEHFLNQCGYGHFQSYYTNGLPNQSWDYDEYGNKIPKSIVVGEPDKEKEPHSGFFE
jgi:antitoxin component YwqK of YwqJK toxin-antitoxin module